MTTRPSPFVDLFDRCPVQMSIDLLREFEPDEGYWLAFSGGKDSISIKQLAVEAGVKFDAHYNVTTCDPPELIKFIRREHPDVRFERPKNGQSIFTQIARRGLPLHRRKWCCDEYKDGAGAGRRVITGIRSEESPRRKNRRQVEACMKDGSITFFHAIKHWTEEMVWWFIRDRGLPYCELYDHGWKRLGCVICPSERRIAEGMDLWPGIWEATRRAAFKFYTKSEALRAKFASAEEYWEWWLDRDSAYAKQDEDQFTMFFQEGD